MTSDMSDPSLLRFYSILPEEDSDETFCARHERWMKTLTPVLHSQGALYTTADGFEVYTCPACLRAMADQVDAEPMDLFKIHLTDSFDQWDAGESHGDWFSYLGEGSLEDFDGGLDVDVNTEQSERGDQS